MLISKICSRDRGQGQGQGQGQGRGQDQGQGFTLFSAATFSRKCC